MGADPASSDHLACCSRLDHMEIGGPETKDQYSSNPAIAGRLNTRRIMFVVGARYSECVAASIAFVTSAGGMKHPVCKFEWCAQILQLL
jgi:hypothetical protein